MLTKNQKQKLLQILKEDTGKKDVTSAILSSSKAYASIRANENCTLAGLEEASFLFGKQKCKVQALAKNGQHVKTGQKILTISGKNKKILETERTALNILGRMSGVATLCTKAVLSARTASASDKTKIFLTRKTMPGFNEFDKKAATHAGVHPHRLNLEEMILIKENHLAFESIENLLSKARIAKLKTKTKKVEIETENPRQAIAAANAKADIILLDNFSLKDAKKALQKIKKINPKILVELSGGINLKNLHKYTVLKPDMISLGSLTKNAKMIDFSLDIKKAEKK